MNRNIVATLLIIAALILLTAETDKHETAKATEPAAQEKPRKPGKIIKF
jgi:hypothetical protein